jgi:hypothetical protein
VAAVGITEKPTGRATGARPQPCGSPPWSRPASPYSERFAKSVLRPSLRTSSASSAESRSRFDGHRNTLGRFADVGQRNLPLGYHFGSSNVYDLMREAEESRMGPAVRSASLLEDAVCCEPLSVRVNRLTLERWLTNRWLTGR